MGFLSGLALVLLTLAGYCYGAALAGRTAMGPGPVDLPLTGILTAGALVSRAMLGRWWAIAVWAAAGILVGAGYAVLRRAAGRGAERPQPAGVPPAGVPSADAASGGPFARRLRRGWVSVTRRAGDYQARLVLMWFYAGIVAPIGLVRRLRRGRRVGHGQRGDSGWQAREPSTADVDQAQRQS